MNYRVLVVPGFHGSGDAHWQTWLQKQLPNSRRIEGVDWEMPVVKAWAKAVTRILDEDALPTVIVAHSFGCLASTLAIANRPNRNLAAVFVAPAQPERFGPFGVRDNVTQSSIVQYLPSGPLNVPGLLVASQNDPWMKMPHAHVWARRWNLPFHDVGKAGHINVESGFGPWPWIKSAVESVGENLAENARIQTLPSADQQDKPKIPQLSRNMLAYS